MLHFTTAMKTTVSLIKADVGSVAGHSKPHPKMMTECRRILFEGMKNGTIRDFYVTRVGDDINLLMTHTRGEDNPDVHKLAWDAFMAATKIAQNLHLYGAGQDLLSEAFSGNVRGMGPGAAEMTFEERKSEPLIVFMADKTEPSAFSLPLCRIFLDPFTTTGLVIDERLHGGFQFEIVNVFEKKRIILSGPEEMYDILAFLGDTIHYALKRVFSKDAGIGTAAVVSTEKLSLIAGKYVGKDDPVCLVRSQAGLPAVGEVLQPFAFPAYVSGWMRGSHYGAWYPCSVSDSDPTYHDGPPRLVALGFQVNDGRLVGLEESGEHIPMDYFEGSCWDVVREEAMKQSMHMRRHGPFMPAILPPEEMEYTTLPAVRKKLEGRVEKL